MTPTSLLPQEAAAVGIGYGALCQTIVEASPWRPEKDQMDRKRITHGADDHTGDPDLEVHGTAAGRLGDLEP